MQSTFADSISKTNFGSNNKDYDEAELKALLQDKIDRNQKYDKEKAKKQKEADANRKFLAEKQNERVTKVLAAKKINDRDFNEKRQAEDQMVK